ncbi:MAG: FAD-binding protein, partial [Pseudomonadales bacterium]|nr:FAD-binding protein [Pseudomonadales bacterium]
MSEAFDHEVDVLIVGSGNGALTSALACYELGVTDVLLVEKGEKIGGTSAISGGGVWIPCNRYAREAGTEDSLEDAREYLRQTIPGNDVPGEMLDTYIEQGPKMIDFMHERTR